MHEIERALMALGVADEVQQVVLRALEGQTARLFATKAKHYVAVVATDGSQVAMYADRRVLSLALEPERARLLGEQMAVGVEKKTSETWYLRLAAAHLHDENVAEVAVSAAREALARCRDRDVRDRRAGGSSKQPDPAACLVCNLQLLPSGACGTETCATE